MNSIKALIIGLGIFINNTQSFSQYDFKEGDIMISLGHGIGSNIDTYSTDESVSITNSFGPIYGKLEYGFGQGLTLGVNLAYAGLNSSQSYTNETVSYGGYPDYENTYHKNTISKTKTWRTFSVLVRINQYFGSKGRLRPYFGIGAGYRYGNNFEVTSTYNHTSQITTKSESNYGYLNRGGMDFLYSNIGFETTLGAKFKFTEVFGAYAEFGIAKSVIQFGITAKF